MKLEKSLKFSFWVTLSTLQGHTSRIWLHYWTRQNSFITAEHSIEQYGTMDGGAWWATVHGVTKSRTRLSDFTFTFHFHALEKEMAIHSSVLAWRIPGTGEPGGLLSLGLHRVRHDWNDLAAAAVIGCRCFSDTDHLRPEVLWKHLIFSRASTFTNVM